MHGFASVQSTPLSGVELCAKKFFRCIDETFDIHLYSVDTGGKDELPTLAGMV